MASVLKALTYARVSTQDQKTDVQIEELKRYCLAREWDLANEIADHGFSGGSDRRPGLMKLMELVRARKVDVVVVTKLDRVARSLRHLVSILDEFSSLGIKFVSVKDQIDMTTASGRLMVHIVGAFAEFERALIRERTIAGLDHARSKGKRLGRPKTINGESILALHLEGLTHRQIQEKLGVSKGTIWRTLKSAPKTPSNLKSKSPTKSGCKND